MANNQLQAIEKRYTKGYDFWKDVEVSQLYDDMEWLMEEVEKLQKENLQLRCWKEAYEKTYHQLVETEGKTKCNSETK